MIAHVYRMILTICLTGLRPGCCSLIQLNVCISGLQTNIHISNLHIAWTILSLKKYHLPITITLALLLIQGLLGQTMLQGLLLKQIQFWAFFNAT